MKVRALRAALHVFVLIFAGLVIASEPASSDSDGALSREEQLKAAFIYKFGDFVEWDDALVNSPSHKNGICIIGHRHFADILGELVALSESSPAKTTLYRPDDLSSPLPCGIIYISRWTHGSAEQKLRYLRGRRMLTVSDAPDFARNGGMIQLVRDKRNIKFVINNSAARAEGIKIRSQLLALATEVVDDSHAP